VGVSATTLTGTDVARGVVVISLSASVVAVGAKGVGRTVDIGLEKVGL